MGDEQRLEFRDALNRLVRTYSFVSQIAVFADPALERDYVYCRALLSCLGDTSTVERLDPGTEVELTQLRHQMTFTSSLSLTAAVGEVRSFLRRGPGRTAGTGPEHLSSIIEVLNDRFGTDLTDVDKLLLDQFEDSWVTGGELADQAQNKSIGDGAGTDDVLPPGTTVPTVVPVRLRVARGCSQQQAAFQASMSGWMSQTLGSQ